MVNNMRDGFEWNGAPTMTDDNMNPLNFGDIMQYYRSQEGWDEETKTYKAMRIKALEKCGEPICQNVLDEFVYIGDCPDVQEYIREYGIEDNCDD